MPSDLSVSEVRDDVTVCGDEGFPLTLEQTHRSLSNLGHNRHGDIVLTTCTLRCMQLLAVEPLAGFPFLQRVSLDENRLTSLKPLAALTGLVYLSAKNNQLCEDEVFPHLTSSASSLERLFLDGNQIACLSGVAQLPYLMDLTVSSNRLTALESEDFLPLKALTRFLANNNNISRVDPNLFSGARQIRSLDLSHNEVTNVHFLAYITGNLETLLLAGNQITTLGATVSECQSLVELDISDNALESVEELSYLQPARLLRFLRISGNPFWLEEAGSTDELGLTAAERVLAATNGGKSIRTVVIEEDVVVADPADFEAAAAANGTVGAVGRASRGAKRPSIRSKRGGSANTAAAGCPSVTETMAAASISNSLVPDRHHQQQQQQQHLDFATLTVPSAYGLVRHVVTASKMAVVPSDMNRAEELGKLPQSQQVFLQLLFLLPSLVKVNDIDIVADDVSRAHFFFAGAVNEVA